MAISPSIDIAVGVAKVLATWPSNLDKMTLLHTTCNSRRRIGSRLMGGYLCFSHDQLYVYITGPAPAKDRRYSQAKLIIQ